MGPVEWLKTAARPQNKNLILGPVYKSIAQFLVKLEDTAEGWLLAPLYGHSCIHELLPFCPADIATLQAHQVNTVSQLFNTPLRGGIDKLFLLH
jgi:hypothetical protein